MAQYRDRTLIYALTVGASFLEYYLQMNETFVNAINSIENIFDAPKNGISNAFKLVLSILEAQREQNEQLINDYEAFKGQHEYSIKLQQEKFQDQLAQVQKIFDDKLLMLKEEVVTLIHHSNGTKSENMVTLQEFIKLQESCKADIAATYEMSQDRLLQLHKKTEDLSAELEILQESLLGGTGVGLSNKSELSIESQSHELFMNREIGTIKHEDSYGLIIPGDPNNIQLPRPSGIVLKNTTITLNQNEAQPKSNMESNLKQTENPDAEDYQSPRHSGHDMDSNDISSDDKNLQNHMEVIVRDNCIGGPNRDNNSLCNHAFQPSFCDINCDSMSNCEEHRNLVINDSTVHPNSQPSLNDIQLAASISSKSVEVINSIYKSVRSRRLSRMASLNPSLTNNAFGVIVHLLDQEKVFQADIKALSNRIDDLCECSRTGTHLDTELSRSDPNIEPRKGICSHNNHTTDVSATQVEDSADAASYVSQTQLQLLLNSIYQSLTKHDTLSTENDEDVFNRIIKKIDQWRDEINRIKFYDFDHILENAKNSLLEMLRTEISTRDKWINESIDSLRQSLPPYAGGIKTGVTTDSSSFSSGESSSIDDKIKLATDNVNNSLRELISSHLGHLSLIEDEVTKLTLQLAERPDDTQINKMIQDLDQIVSDRIGKTDIFQDILEGMKQEMRKKMTKDEVISLVHSLIDNAKHNIRTTSSLMIGRVPYRCIGCDRLFTVGVNDQLATKVNHDALPFCIAPRKSLKKVMGSSRMIKNRPRTACDNSGSQRYPNLHSP